MFQTTDQIQFLSILQLLHTKFLKSTEAKLLLGSAACATLSAPATPVLCNKTLAPTH